MKMSSNHDPWANVQIKHYPAHGSGVIAFYSVEEVDRARSADRAAHQQEIANLKAMHAIDLNGASERAQMILKAKNHWLDACTSAQAERDQALAALEARAEIARLRNG